MTIASLLTRPPTYRFGDLLARMRQEHGSDWCQPTPSYDHKRNQHARSERVTVIIRFGTENAA